MYIGLYLVKPEIISGDYPKIDEKNIKKHMINSLDDALKLGQFFLDNINEECETLLAPYDVDIFMPEQCRRIKDWIQTNDILIKESGLEELFKIINEYCDKAIELDTGMEIEV